MKGKRDVGGIVRGHLEEASPRHLSLISYWESVIIFIFGLSCRVGDGGLSTSSLVMHFSFLAAFGDVKRKCRSCTVCRRGRQRAGKVVVFEPTRKMWIFVNKIMAKIEVFLRAFFFTYLNQQFWSLKYVY